MSYVDIKKLMARATESSSIYREYGLMLGVPKIIMKMGARGPQNFMTPAPSMNSTRLLLATLINHSIKALCFYRSVIQMSKLESQCVISK